MAEHDDGVAGRKNRTLIGTVVFADIVGFSQRAVSDQTSIKEHFNGVVAEACRDVAPVYRLMLDTGDGVALCLLGDPEEGLFVALSMRDSFGLERPSWIPSYEVRIGLNLGPMKIVTDLNGRLNAIGDAVNVAQRVMSFAEPGQVLCSRSYFEIVSRLSDDYVRLFEYCGVRHDKHVREHDVYEVRTPSATVTAPFELPATPAIELPTELVESLTALLAKSEGPLAKIMLRKACEQAPDFATVVERVTAEMSDVAEAQKFATAARKAGERAGWVDTGTP